jgi:hypothetical protein
MSTVANLIEEARYDLMDFEEGLEFDDKLLYVYLNRMIRVMDSQLAALRHDLVHANETNIDTVSSQDYVDLTNMNNGYWDSVKSVWIGEDRKYPLTIDQMMYKRKWYSSDAEPQYWTLDNRRLLFETTADSAHTDFVIHYNKKHRPRLESYTSTFTVDAANDDVQPSSGSHTFVTGDGPFTLTNSGGALPAGLATSTNYWVIFDPDNPADFMLASSKANALDGTQVTISDAGTGTHTITMGNDLMPYDGVFDDVLREMLVMHGKGRLTGQLGQVESIYSNVFRKRAMEETIRRRFAERYYGLNY